MSTQLIPGARVVYVPEQNKGDNIHHEATIVSVSSRSGFYRISANGKERNVHRKRLLVGQVDAFISEDREGRGTCESVAAAN